MYSISDVASNLQRLTAAKRYATRMAESLAMQGHPPQIISQLLGGLSGLTSGYLPVGTPTRAESPIAPIARGGDMPPLFKLMMRLGLGGRGAATALQIPGLTGGAIHYLATTTGQLPFEVNKGLAMAGNNAFVRPVPMGSQTGFIMGRQSDYDLANFLLQMMQRRK